MKHNKIVELCKQYHIIPIAKDFIFKDNEGKWNVDVIDCCMWTEKGYSFDTCRHCSNLSFIENDHHSGMTKIQVWDSIAEDIIFEGNDVGECECDDYCKEEV